MIPFAEQRQPWYHNCVELLHRIEQAGSTARRTSNSRRPDLQVVEMPEPEAGGITCYLQNKGTLEKA
jgi:hypothetical protein